MSTINREEFITCLDSVSPGLATREITEQSESGCFTFLNKRVITFNEEIACSMQIPIKISGTLKAKPLLELLKKMPDDILHIHTDDGKLVIEGKKRLGRFLLEKETSQSFAQVPEPTEWNVLSSDFIDGINLVYRCAGKEFGTLDPYVHVHPKRIEACSGTQQVGIFYTTTNFKKPILVHKDSIKHTVPLGMVEFSISDSWVHFRNKKGLVLSCRLQDDSFPDTSELISIGGTKINLPKGIADASVRASIFSKDNIDNTEVIVVLKPGKIIIKGIGVCGDFKESKNIKYNGEEIFFLMSPQLLTNLVKNYNEAWITKDTLKVKTGKFTFITALGSPKDEKEETTEEETEDENG